MKYDNLYIGKVRDGELKVLFFDKGRGIVLNDSCKPIGINTGYYYDRWYDGGFEDVTKEELENTKIRILSPEHSELVQRLAIKAGYRWPVDGADVIVTDRPFLHLDNGRIKYSSNPHAFEKSINTEIEIPMPPETLSEQDGTQESIALTGSLDLTNKEDKWPRVGDEVVATRKDNNATIEGQLLAVTAEYAIIQQVGHEQHIYVKDWTLSEPKSLVDKVAEQLSLITDKGLGADGSYLQSIALALVNNKVDGLNITKEDTNE